MPTYPGSRPTFAERETYNEVADSAALTRRLMDWQSWTWASDLTRTPGDWRQMDAGGNEGPRARQPGSSSQWQVSVSQFYVPPSRNGSRTLRVSLYRESSSWAVKLTNVATGEITNVAVGTGWTSVDIACEGPATFRVDWTTYGSGAVLRSLSAYWVPPSVVGSWQPISQTYVAAGVADSAYLLRWLARTSDLFAAWKSQNVVQTSFMEWRRGNVGADTYWHRYKVMVSPKVTKLNVIVNSQRTAGYSGAIKIFINGSQVGAFQPPSGYWAWTPATCNINGGSGYSVPTEIEVSIGHDAIGVSDYVGVAGVTAYEGGGDANGLSASDLGLPGGQSVPSSFKALYRELIVGREAIRADKDHLGRSVGRADLVKNMMWLWARRLPSYVLNQSIYYGYKKSTADNFVWPMNDAAGTGGNLVLGYYYLHPTFPVAEVANRLWRVRLWNAFWTGGSTEDDVEYLDIQHYGSGVGQAKAFPEPFAGWTKYPQATEYWTRFNGDWLTKDLPPEPSAAPTEFWLRYQGATNSYRDNAAMNGCIFEERPLTEVSADAW